MIIYWLCKNISRLFISMYMLDGYYFMFNKYPKVVLLEGYMFHAWQDTIQHSHHNTTLVIFGCF